MYSVYACVSEERVVRALALLCVFAMVGIAAMPMVVGEIVGGLYVAGVVNERGATAAGLVAGGWSAIGSAVATYYGTNVVLLGLTGAALGGAILAGVGVGLL